MLKTILFSHQFHSHGETPWCKSLTM